MNKNNELKKDIFAIFIYILTFVVIYLILTTDNHLFASNVDFRTQHYLIPEYFRNQFYNTHDLLPDFAFNLGGGQNIYYLSYYGLLNPIILISYLFPNIKMIDYMSHVHNNRLIHAGLPKEAIFIHKTGDIGKMLGDAGIVYTPNGKKYIVVMLVNRPYNSPLGKDFIVAASSLIYNYMVNTNL